MKLKELMRKFQRGIWKELSQFSHEIWIHNYTQIILSDKVEKIRTKDANLIRQMISWANCYEPIEMFASMCNAVGIMKFPIYLESYINEIGSIQITARIEKQQDEPLLIELSYSSDMERKLSWITEKEERHVCGTTPTKFSAEWNELDFKLVFSAMINKLVVCISNENKKRPLMTIVIRGTKRKEKRLVEIYEETKKIIASERESLLSGALLENIINLFKISYHIEYIKILYDGKTTEFVKNKLVSYKDSKGLELLIGDNRTYRCPISDGIVVELKDGKYNVYHIPATEEISYIKEAEKIIDRRIAENEI